jgi:[acyl-carrier-protein] S-malonyltransferase
MSIAFIFPGQGSQSVGMGVDLAEAFAAAREVFQEVDDALGQKLFALMKQLRRRYRARRLRRRSLAG